MSSSFEAPVLESTTSERATYNRMRACLFGAVQAWQTHPGPCTNPSNTSAGLATHRPVSVRPQGCWQASMTINGVQDPMDASKQSTSTSEPRLTHPPVANVHKVITLLWREEVVEDL